jgi:hypothetical protein
MHFIVPNPGQQFLAWKVWLKTAVLATSLVQFLSLHLLLSDWSFFPRVSRLTWCSRFLSSYV